MAVSEVGASLLAVVDVSGLSVTTLLLALAAGFVSFLSPCVVPLLPVYLSFVSGVAVEDLGRRWRRLLAAALLFVLGFTVVFVALGLGAGGVGQWLLRYRSHLEIVAGVIVLLGGLVVVGAIRLPQFSARIAPRRAGLGGAVPTGAALAVAWTPCVGPVLGAILALAASTQSVWQGAVLLLAYSVGFAIPFILAALAFNWVMARLAIVKRHLGGVRLAAGALLIIFGLLMIFGLFEKAMRWLPALNPTGL